MRGVGLSEVVNLQIRILYCFYPLAPGGDKGEGLATLSPLPNPLPKGEADLDPSYGTVSETTSDGGLTLPALSTAVK